MMDAFHINRRVAFRPLPDRAENARLVDQFALQDGGDLRSLGHDVVADQMLRVRRVERGFELGEVAGRDDPGFIHQRRVEVARIERHELDVGHSFFLDRERLELRHSE